MSEHALPINEHEVPAVDTEHRVAHATDKTFVIIALILAAVTAIEVAWTYIVPEGNAWMENGGLLGMMLLKFFIVASYFMHLKWDSKLLSAMFYFGVILAIIVYIIMLTTFEFWQA